MFGLMVLLGFAIWCGMTFAAALGGYKLGKRFHYPKTGAFIGFMLLMGGWFVYWAVEYIHTQSQTTALCEKEAGITVYVTPEEWRKQIGEEAWANLAEFDSGQERSYRRGDIVYEQKKYIPTTVYNNRLVKYNHSQKVAKFIGKMEVIVIDIKDKKVILRYTYFSAGVGNWLTGGSPKFWLNSIRSCSGSVKQQFSNYIKSYSNNI